MSAAGRKNVNWFESRAKADRIEQMQANIEIGLVYLPPTPPEDPLIANRNALYQRFEPEKAERLWRRWLEQREAIDREFDRTHPYWEEYLRRKGRFVGH